MNFAPSLAPPHRLLLEPLVRNALLEDLGRAGDVTSDAIAPPDARARAVLAARQKGVIAGLELARIAFELVDPRVSFIVEHDDGAHVAAGARLATLEGPARAILTAERTALNFLSHLSGIATVTASIVAAVSGSNARVVCTRKTTPGLRAVEKYAVRAGGGANHRFGLDDAMLIKDNHVALAGSVGEAVRRAKAAAGHLVKIELEVDTLEQLAEALDQGVDAVLLDNMTPDALREAVTLIDGRAISEASGRITAQTAAAVAATGVDVISVGWLTHSAPILDIGLDFEADQPA
ncbi:carboxylating nicotinate-nucleotide diphosphorylase [Methylocella sp.]|uniref:carboxylating nicotinate-nucleotide diphosphorylase n=1 Tax=Methylocella sp. TaxID=1978226 RepID=UPI0037846B77